MNPLLQPPAGVAPERLFRLLVQRPRAEMPIAFRFAGIDEPLAVRALRGPESSAQWPEEGLPASVAEGRHLAGLIAAALRHRGAPVFETPEQASDLAPGEFYALAGAVVEALSVISPLLGRVDRDAWLTTLAKGAWHPSNRVDAEAMCLAHDVVLGSKVYYHPRPDRYYGAPLCELTDGQMLAFTAARKHLK